MKNLMAGLLLIISINAFGQEMECKDFKNGKFELVDEKTGNSIIDRKGSRQVEYGEGSDLKLEFRVKWLNECTYTLELIKVLENPKNIELPKGMIVTVEIIETKENSYVQKTTSNISEMVLESELFRID